MALGLAFGLSVRSLFASCRQLAGWGLSRIQYTVNTLAQVL